MGFILCALLWSVIVLEEIEKFPISNWSSSAYKTVFKFRYTRKRIVFLICFFLGLFLFVFELFLTIQGRSTFNVLQAIGMLAILLSAFVFGISKKG
jgi:drug/metabolite transporter (DMT)-like permease